MEMMNSQEQNGRLKLTIFLNSRIIYIQYKITSKSLLLKLENSFRLSETAKWMKSILFKVAGRDSSQAGNSLPS